MNNFGELMNLKGKQETILKLQVHLMEELTKVEAEIAALETPKEGN